MSASRTLNGTATSGTLKYADGVYVNNSLTATLQATFGFAGVVGRFYVQDPRYLRSAEAVYVNTAAPEDRFTVNWVVDNRVSSMGSSVNFAARNARVSGLDSTDDAGTYQMVSLRLEDYWVGRSSNVKFLSFSGSLSPSTLTLLGPPNYTYQLGAPSSVDEGGFADFTVSRSGATGFKSTVNFSTVAVNATAGIDFASLQQVNVQFGENDTSRLVRVKVVMDTLSEQTETFKGQLFASTTSTTPLTEATVSIRDVAPNFAYTMAVKAGVLEGGFAFFDVIRTGTVDLPSTVYVSTRSGTALQGSDFTALNRVAIAFASGQQERTASLATLEDGEREVTESYLLDLFESPTATTPLLTVSGEIQEKDSTLIMGTARAENLRGNSLNNVIIGMGGADVLTGDAGQDVFRYLNLSDSGITIAAQDRITDFLPRLDKIDLSALDANPAIAGDQAFTGFISMTTGFSQPGQMKLNHNGNSNFTLFLNTNTNSAAEAAINIQLIGSPNAPPPSMGLSDLIL